MRLARCSLTQMMKLAKWSLGFLLPLEFRFSPSEGDVSKSDHMLNLPLHGDAEEGYEVHHQDGPEHGDVEELKEGTEESDGRSLSGGVPELELRQPTDEGPELLILISRKHVWPVLIRIQLCHGGVYLGGQECQQQVQVVDC